MSDERWPLAPGSRVIAIADIPMGDGSCILVGTIGVVEMFEGSANHDSFELHYMRIVRFPRDAELPLAYCYRSSFAPFDKD